MLQANISSKSYNNNQILQDLNLEIKAGERVALMGASGVGKTSLIHILAGLDDDFIGEVVVNTVKTGVVFQDAGLFAHKTVRENIAYALRGKKMHTSTYQHWLNVCNLHDVEQYYPFQLSRGMKQRVAIIRGFISEPELIFLDEPFSGQDQSMATRIMDHILKNHGDSAMLVASHTGMADGFCHRVFMLE